MATFSAFNLSPKLVAALDKLGYHEPSPVQANVIPKALQGQSLICQSETGSGKTHAYLIPILQKIDPNLPRLQDLVICPSRELARQVYEFAKPFERFFPHLKIRLLTSEAEKTQNSEGLSQAPQLVIGTPGRLKDLLIDEYALDLHNLRTLVLDEADMLMDLGYFNDIDTIYSKLSSEPQVMVFSATLTPGLKEKLHRYIKSDFLYESEQHMTASGVSHHLVDIKHVGALEALKSFLRIRNPYLVLVFASRKEDVNKIYEGLKEEKWSVVLFSGDLEQRERRKTIRLIKENRYQVIVASDLLSRGIDIEDVSDVISIDLPNDQEFYFHRAGRTGRFGKKGDSWVFYNADTVSRPQELLKAGVPFDFYTLKGDKLEIDPVGLLPKKKLSKKKAFPEEELRDVKIAKANSRVKRVKPAYKKKMRWAVEKVKNKYRHKAIERSIRKRKSDAYKAQARQVKNSSKE
jgi:ATP-dependent RNA helicase CshB